MWIFALALGLPCCVPEPAPEVKSSPDTFFVAGMVPSLEGDVVGHAPAFLAKEKMEAATKEAGKVPSAVRQRASLKIPAREDATKVVRGQHKQTRSSLYGQEAVQHLPPRSSASVSRGTTTSGTLLEGVSTLSATSSLWVMEKTRGRDYVYGTKELVDGLVRAAEHVSLRHEGNVRLALGNMSRKGGGDIPQSKSHNSGRDVDVAFYMTNADSTSVEPQWFIAFDGNGESEEPAGYLFDTKRNWTFVEALLGDPSIQVQYIFVADWLRTLLLNHGIASLEGASEQEAERLFAVIKRAERVLRQPTDSSPHREHFHIRLYCSGEDRERGCHNTGVIHPWVKTFHDAVQARIDQLVEMHTSSDPDERKQALLELDSLRQKPEYLNEDEGAEEEL